MHNFFGQYLGKPQFLYEVVQTWVAFELVQVLQKFGLNPNFKTNLDEWSKQIIFYWEHVAVAVNFLVGDFENRGLIMLQDRVGDRTGDTPTGQDLTNCEAPDEFPLFLEQNSMEALHENVEWTKVIEVLTPFSWGYREKDLRWVIAPSRLCKEH